MSEATELRSFISHVGNIGYNNGIWLGRDEVIESTCLSCLGTSITKPRFRLPAIIDLVTENSNQAKLENRNTENHHNSLTFPHRNGGNATRATWRTKTISPDHLGHAASQGRSTTGFLKGESNRSSTSRPISRPRRSQMIISYYTSQMSGESRTTPLS